jgi:hypothetical protein
MMLASGRAITNKIKNTIIAVISGTAARCAMLNVPPGKRRFGTISRGSSLQK